MASPKLVAKALKHLTSFTSHPHPSFEEEAARDHSAEPLANALVGVADDAFSNLSRKLQHKHLHRATREAYIRRVNGTCYGGVGLTIGFMRTILHFALAYNLTYVHSPITRYAHGEDAAEIDTLLGLDESRCNFACIDRRLASGELRAVPFGGFPLPVLDAEKVPMPYGKELVASGRLWRAKGSLDRLIVTTVHPGIEDDVDARWRSRAAPVVFDVGGQCVTRKRIDAPTRSWMRDRYEESFGRLGRTAAKRPGLVSIAVHYRAGNAFSLQHGRLIHPGVVNVTVRSVVAGLELAGVPRASIGVTIFSEGIREWFEREHFFAITPAGMPAVELKLGDKSSTAADIDAMAHSDVLVMGRSSFSNVIATITRGLVVLSPLATDEPWKHELSPVVLPTKTGFVAPEKVASAWRLRKLADRM